MFLEIRHSQTEEVPEIPQVINVRRNACIIRKSLGMKKQDGAWQGESFRFLPRLSTQSRERAVGGIPTQHSCTGMDQALPPSFPDTES